MLVTVFTILIAAAAVLLVSSSSPRAAVTAPASVLLPPDQCAGAQRAIGYYRRAFTWQRGRALLPGAPPRAWYGCDVTRRRSIEWRTKARAAKAYTIEWLYEWRKWLPGNWRAVGTCETGYGGDPNFEHANSSFVSAFGISRREYDADARHMGAKPWNDRNPPPPRHQYLAALGHYDRFGDGWSCPGP